MRVYDLKILGFWVLSKEVYLKWEALGKGRGTAVETRWRRRWWESVGYGGGSRNVGLTEKWG